MRYGSLVIALLVALSACGDPLTPEADRISPEGVVPEMVASATAQGQGSTVETVDVMDQEDVATGERVVYAANAATLRRTDNGISVRIKMPTPEAGEYRYPDDPEDLTQTAAPLGHPQVFTLWVFVFDEELGPFGEFPWTSVFFGAGHPVGGDNLTLSGHISTNTEPFAGFDLENPRDVEIHLAVAPHGGLDDNLMPEQIKTPALSPPMWWVAVFDPAR